jgi:integrase
MLILILELGARPSEFLNTRVRDFNRAEQSIFIRGLKGSNDRELPILPKRAGALERVVLDQYGVREWRELDPDAALFPIGYHRLAQIWDLFRPNPDKSIKALRHTFAVNLYGRTKDLRIVQMCLGHRNVMNTIVYLDFWIAQNDLRKLMHG